jgi:hypothetical protein
VSLRLIKPGLSAATGIFHPSLIHPRTGQPLEAVGVGKNGQPMWPVLGAADDDDKDDDADKDDDKDEEDDDDSSDDADDADDDDTDDGKKPKGLNARIKALEDEKERHYKKRKQAEKELEELRAFKKEKDEEGLSEADKAKKAAEETTARERRQAAELQELKRERAFLVANDIDWHDREDALRAIDWDEVEVSEDGKVDRKSLKAELKRLAKAKPWLVKKAESSDDDEDEDGKKDKPSAGSMNGKKKGKKEPSREELAKKFPALLRR